MKVVSSYGVEIKKQNIPIRHTLYIYRQAVEYLIRVYEESWEELSRIVNPQKRFNAAEHLVHSTKKNWARYDWNCGNKRNWTVSQSLYMKIMQCRYSTGM